MKTYNFAVQVDLKSPLPESELVDFITRAIATQQGFYAKDSVLAHADVTVAVTSFSEPVTVSGEDVSGTIDSDDMKDDGGDNVDDNEDVIDDENTDDLDPDAEIVKEETPVTKPNPFGKK